MVHFRPLVAAATVVFSLVGCTPTMPDEALQLTPASLEFRELSTRRFASTDEAMMLSSAAQVLQDLGFSIDESEPELGVLVASKKAEAENAGQIAGAIILAALTGVAVPFDDDQLIRASLVTRPAPDGVSMTLRATFQRVVTNNYGQVSRVESLQTQEVYRRFFEKLGQSVFLEAEKI